MANEDQTHPDKFAEQMGYAALDRENPEYRMIEGAAHEFWDGLGEDEDMGVVWNGIVFRLEWITRVGNLPFVVLDGKKPDGNPVRAVLHFSQLNLGFVVLPGKKQPFGFAPKPKALG